MKIIVQNILKFFSKKIIRKYNPLIIGITGSVGKTSAKEAIFAVLSDKKNVRRSIKNYNNEIGVPLTIIGEDARGRSVSGWLKVFFKAFKIVLITDENYPKILILEMGVDRPGDMDYLNSIVQCKIGIVTLIGSAHVEYFGTLERIQREKGKLIESLPKDGYAILNYDNEKTRQLKGQSRAKVITYGFDKKANIRAQEIKPSLDEDRNIQGVSFKLTYNGSSVPVFLPGVLGASTVSAALSGAAVAITQNINLIEISKALKKIKFPKGRMSLVKGIKRTLIIDDTYNSSPQSVISALGVFKEIPIDEGSDRIAILGDMMELGSYSEEGHQEVGKYLAKLEVDKLITVGERSRDIGRGAKKNGMKEDYIFHFADNTSAGKFLQEIIKEGDAALIKGSQGMRMEKIVKEVMAEPQKSEELLVRQEKEWLKK